jgi:hypothetical protein
MAGLSDLAAMIGRGVQGVATLGMSEMARSRNDAQGQGMLQYLNAKTPEERAMAAQGLLVNGASLKDLVDLTAATAPKPANAPNVQFNPTTGEMIVSQYDPNTGKLTMSTPSSGVANEGGAAPTGMSPRAQAEYDVTKAKNMAEAEKVKSEDSAQLQQFRAVSGEALKRLEAIPDENFGPIGGRLSKITGDQSKQVLNSKLQDMVGKVRILSKYPAAGFSDSDAARLEAIVGGQVDIGKDALRDIITDMQSRFDAFDGNSGALVKQSPKAAQINYGAMGAKQAPDGNWYVEQNGKFFKVVP